jgi:hypothetical protein
MKRYLKIALSALMMSLTLVACSDRNSPADNDNYYVRYSLSTPTIIYSVQYADVDGMKTETLAVRDKDWTVTIGPVKKGFKAYVKTLENTATAKIEVCKNSEPFALKATGKDSATYTIDF